MTIDDKLRNKIYKLTDHWLHPDEIAQIKAVFAEEGYGLVDTIVWSSRNDVESVDIKGVSHLSGAEWYERFEKQMKGKVFLHANDDSSYVRDAIEVCRQAAKKAAGL